MEILYAILPLLLFAALLNRKPSTLGETLAALREWKQQRREYVERRIAEYYSRHPEELNWKPRHGGW